MPVLDAAGVDVEQELVLFVAEVEQCPLLLLLLLLLQLVLVMMLFISVLVSYSPSLACVRWCVM